MTRFSAKKKGYYPVKNKTGSSGMSSRNAIRMTFKVGSASISGSRTKPRACNWGELVTSTLNQKYSDMKVKNETEKKDENKIVHLAFKGKIHRRDVKMRTFDLLRTSPMTISGVKWE